MKNLHFGLYCGLLALYIRVLLLYYFKLVLRKARVVGVWKQNVANINIIISLFVVRTCQNSLPHCQRLVRLFYVREELASQTRLFERMTYERAVVKRDVLLPNRLRHFFWGDGIRVALAHLLLTIIFFSFGL